MMNQSQCVLMPNDILEIHLPREIPSVNLIPYARKLEVLYEDAFIIIVTKPNNQNCTPSREHPHESLIEQVLYHCQDHGENINPHIVTRLDRNTTGIVIFAKYGHIHHLFSKGNLKKYILALYMVKPIHLVLLKLILDGQRIVL